MNTYIMIKHVAFESGGTLVLKKHANELLFYLNNIYGGFYRIDND